MAATLSVAWLAAEVLQAPVIAAAAALGAIAGACLLAAPRRRPHRLALALAPVLLVLTGMLALFLLRPEHPEGLQIQLAVLLVLAPIVPLIYAATFPREPG